jgi:hypothetical protein
VSGAGNSHLNGTVGISAVAPWKYLYNKPPTLGLPQFLAEIWCGTGKNEILLYFKEDVFS